MSSNTQTIRDHATVGRIRDAGTHAALGMAFATRISALFSSPEAAKLASAFLLQVSDPDSAMTPDGPSTPLDTLAGHVAGAALMLSHGKDADERKLFDEVLLRLRAKNAYYDALLTKPLDKISEEHMAFTSHDEILAYFTSPFFALTGRSAARRQAMEELALAYEACLVMRLVPVLGAESRRYWATMEAALPNSEWLVAVRAMRADGSQVAAEAAVGACRFFLYRPGDVLTEQGIREVMSFVESLGEPLRSMAPRIEASMRSSVFERRAQSEWGKAPRTLWDRIRSRMAMALKQPGRAWAWLKAASKRAWEWASRKGHDARDAAKKAADKAGEVIQGNFDKGKKAAAAATVAAATVVTPAAAAPDANAPAATVEQAAATEDAAKALEEKARAEAAEAERLRVASEEQSRLALEDAAKAKDARELAERELAAAVAHDASGQQPSMASETMPSHQSGAGEALAPTNGEVIKSLIRSGGTVMFGATMVQLNPDQASRLDAAGLEVDASGHVRLKSGSVDDKEIRQAFMSVLKPEAAETPDIQVADGGETKAAVDEKSTEAGASGANGPAVPPPAPARRPKGGFKAS